MANSIAKAVAYINNDAELDKIFKATSFVADLIKPNVAVGADTVKYRQVAFASTTLGSYNKSTGYTAKDINVTWVTKQLTQDKGDSLLLDKMDGEEAQGLEIATVHNKYVKTIQIPAVDTYSFSAIAATSGVGAKTETAALTKSTVEGAIDVALDALYSAGVREDVLLYISTPVARLLKQAAKASGSLSFGSWNGDFSAKVEVYGDTLKAKVIEVPSNLFPAKTNFILVAKDAVSVHTKHKEAVFFDRIPGHGGRRTQIDSGIYYDAWVEPGAESAVYVNKVQ